MTEVFSPWICLTKKNQIFNITKNEKKLRKLKQASCTMIAQLRLQSLKYRK